MSDVGISFESSSDLEEAALLAKRLNLPLSNDAPIQLHLGSEGLSLRVASYSDIRLEFKRAHYQKRGFAFKQQGLLQAIRPQKGMRIIDTTAGFGRDAALLAISGASVLMLERHPLLAALLADAVVRKDEDLALFIQEKDALEYLKTISEKEYPDVIYIDPMHPSRSKSALVKKEMQILQALIPPSVIEVIPLIKLAMTRALKKVVVKWPAREAPLIEPNYSIMGKTVRFDVYQIF